MATNDGGAGPTDLSGVTYLGRPSEESSQSYHIKRSSGKVLGPFDADLIVQMIRGGKLTGDEGVSQDRVSWVPIMAVQRFAETFREQSPADTGNTLFGVQAVSEIPRPAEPGASGNEPTLVTSRDDLSQADGGAPNFPAPLGASGLGVTEDSTMTMASGNWASLDDGSDHSLSDILAPNPDALSNVSGVRPLSTQAMSPQEFLGEPQHSTTELPTPQGFTHFPSGEGEDDGLPRFPSADEVLNELNAQSGASAFDAPEPEGFVGAPRFDSAAVLNEPFDDGAPLPGAAPVGGTVEFGGFPGAASGGGTMAMSGLSGADLPMSQNENLPTSAGSNLPVSAESNLPVSAGTNLPVSAGSNLPTSAGTNLPTPAGTNLPRTSAELPGSTSAFGAPPSDNESLFGVADGGNFGTQAMSGIDVGADLPASRHQFDLGDLGDESGGGSELPASARGVGTSVLDQMAEAEDIWAAPDPPAGGVSSQREFGKRPDTGINFATEEIGFELDPSASYGAAGEALRDSGSFDDFFPESEGNNEPTRVAEAPEPSFEAPPADVGEPLVQAEPAPARSKSGGGGAMKIVGAIVVLGVLAGGGYFAATQLGGGGGESPDTAPEEVVTPTPVIAPEVPGIETIYAGTYDGYVLYVGDARTAVEQRNDADDRAKLVIASALLLAEHPASAQVLDDLRANASALEGEASPSELVRLAQGAYLAVIGDADAGAALEPLQRGTYAGLAHLFEGLAAVQNYRGVDYSQPTPAAAPPAEEVAEGSGEANGSGDAAAAQEAEAVAAADAVEEEVEEVVRTLDSSVAAFFDAAARAQPDLVSAHFWRGWVGLELSNADGAETAFAAALTHNEGHVPSLVGASRALLLQGRLGEADGRIQQVIDGMEGSSSAEVRADAFVAAAEVSIARLQPQLAIESLLSALQADATNRRALAMLGDQFYRARQYQRAIEYFETNADLGDDDPEAALGLARSRIGLQLFDDARSGLETGMQQNPRDARFPYLLGQVYEQEAEFDLARQYYRQALQIEPEFTRPTVALARLAERENKPGEAIELLERAQDANQTDPATANDIGEMYLRLGDTNRAVTAFRRSLELDQSQPFARINLTEYYLDTGQQERAIEYIDQMVDSGIDSPRVRFLNARALEGKGEYERGIEIMIELLDSDPDNADYMHMAGLLQFGAGNYEAAKTYFQSSFDAAPSMNESLYYVGRSETELGNYADAITALTTATQRSPKGAYYYWLGVALEEGMQPAQALLSYSQCIEDDIAWALENPEVFHRRGALYYTRGLLGASYRDVRTALTLMPEHASASLTLGQVYFDNRRFAAAIAAMERSLELDPNQPGVHYSIALASLRSEDADLEKARVHFEAARDGGHASMRPDLYRRLAYVYRDLGQREMAVEMLEEYLETSTLAADEARETENEIARLGGRR